MIILIVMLLGSMSAAGAQEGDNLVVVPPEGRLQLGLATSLSGDTLPEPGTDVRNAVILALNAYNEAGGLLGWEIELVIEDDQCKPELASASAEYLSQLPNLVGVVGHLCSGATNAGLPFYEEAGLPVISPSATSASLTRSGYSVFNRLIFSDAAQGVVVARYIREILGVEQIAVLHDGDSYGAGLAEILIQAFEQAGGEVVYTAAIEPAVDMRRMDYSAVISAMVMARPDLVFYGGYHEEAAQLIEQIRRSGLGRNVPFFGGDGVRLEAFLDAAGPAAEGVYTSAPIATGGDPEENAAFDEAYEEFFGVAPDVLGPYHAQAYDAVQLFLQGLEAVAEVDEDGNLVVDRAALLDYIRSTQGYEGLSGIVTCDANGDCGASLIQVFRVEDGSFVEQEVPEELQINPLDDARG